MKKIALILCVMIIMSLGLVACAENDEGNNTGNTDTNTGTNGTGTGTNGNGTNGTGTGTNGNGTNGTGTDGGNGAPGAGTGDELKGSAQGYGGEVTVTVTVDGDDIVSVEAVGEKETQGVGSKAIEELPDKIEDADSTDVEVVTGATVTSNAIKEAVDKALEDK